MVVNDVGKVIGGQTVPLQQHLVIQGLVLHGDIPEDGVVEGGGALLGDLLADDIGLPSLNAGQGLVQRQVPAGVGSARKVAGVLLRLALLAEAVVGVALLHQQSGILAIGVPALGLDIGGHGAAHIGPLVVVQAALGQGAVDDVGGTLHQPALVGVLDAQDKGPSGVAGDEPGVQGGAQIAHVHISRGRGGKAGAHLPLGDLGLHLLKIFLIQHVVSSITAAQPHDLILVPYYRGNLSVWQGRVAAPSKLPVARPSAPMI